MFIKVAADNRVTLEEPGNFRAFKVVVDAKPSSLDGARRTLTGTAELVDKDTAWVSETALRHWPEVAQDAAWQQSLSTMIEKAKPHGWIDEQRRAIKAHIEWTVPE